MRENPFPIPYVASLSDKLRLAAALSGSDQMQANIESIIEDIHNNRPVAASLQVPVAGYTTLRQVDIREGVRPPPGAPKAKIIMKAFVSWDHNYDRWHIFVEYADEDFWEKLLKPETEDGGPGNEGEVLRGDGPATA